MRDSSEQAEAIVTAEGCQPSLEPCKAKPYYKHRKTKILLAKPKKTKKKIPRDPGSPGSVPRSAGDLFFLFFFFGFSEEDFGFPEILVWFCLTGLWRLVRALGRLVDWSMAASPWQGYVSLRTPVPILVGSRSTCEQSSI